MSTIMSSSEEINEGHEYFTRIVAPSIGSVLSILLYIFQYKTYRNIEKNHSTGDVNVLPILLLHINSLLWILYGYLTYTPAIIPINTVGTLFTLFYIILYYSGCDTKKRRVIEIVLMAEHAFFTAFTGFAVYALPALEIPPNTPVGVAAITANIGFYAAPLSSLYGIIKTRSTKSLSLPLTGCSFACAAFWTVFGIGEKDFFVWIPNALGLLFSVMQLILFLVYNLLMKTGGPPSTMDEINKNPSAYVAQADEDEDEFNELNNTSFSSSYSNNDDEKSHHELNNTSHSSSYSNDDDEKSNHEHNV